MAKRLYLKLAFANLRRNRRLNLPYFIATAIMSAVFLMVSTIATSRSISNLSYGNTIQQMFRLGMIVMSIFTAVYMLYINSFLIKQRKREFGLYGILGLEKRHVGRIIFWESVLLNLSALALGLLGGAAFGRLIFALLLRAIRVAPGSVFTLSGLGFGITLLVFGIVFVLSTLYNLFQVRLANPVELMSGARKVEKKPRFLLPLTLLGLAGLGWAYYTAITVDNAITALLQFFLAVVVVIFATWALFTSGSVFILGALRRNKRFYYQPDHFVSVSGLIQRMKQNAAGLSNICILVTMVIVTISCVTSLYLGQEEMLKQRSPDDVRLLYASANRDPSADTLAGLEKRISAQAEEAGVRVQNMLTYQELYQPAPLGEGEDSLLYELHFITAKDYAAVTGHSANLGAEEVLLLTEADLGGLSTLPAGDREYAVADILPGTPFTVRKHYADPNQVYVVAADREIARGIVSALSDVSGDQLWFSQIVVLDIEGTEEDGAVFATGMRGDFYDAARAFLNSEGGSTGFDNIFTKRLDSYGTYGGLVFLGIFFAILFLTNTILLIYFKQVSEGFEDRERFDILQKVGMDDQEVKRTINRQVRIVFFLPLAAALLHVAAATNMIVKMLEAFELYNVGLSLLCIVLTALSFALVYLFFYRQTAKTYYKLVKRT